MKQQMTAAATSMTARTSTIHGHREPSPTALGSRSLREAYEITDPAARGRAIELHFARFVSAPGSGSCPARHR